MVEIEKMKHQLELIGGIDPETLQEHEETEKRWEFLNTQTKDLKKTIMSMDKLIDELDGKIKKQFNNAFKKIATNFTKYFKLIFDGGNAKLSLLMEEEKPDEDEEDQGEGTQEPRQLGQGVHRSTGQTNGGAPGQWLWASLPSISPCQLDMALVNGKAACRNT